MNFIKSVFLILTSSISFYTYTQITVNYTGSSTALTAQGGGGPDACGADRFSLKEGPAVFEGCIRMTPPNFNDNGGVAWVCDPIDLDSSFNLSTTVTFGSNPDHGDGVVFVLKTESSPNVVGGVGGNIGYHNPGPTGRPIGESLGIEFDSFVGGPFDDGLTCEHAQMVKDGDLTDKIGPANCLIPGGGDVNDGLPHEICITWDALNNVYQAYFDGENVIDYNGDIRGYFDNPNEVYWGFTAGDGGGTDQNNHLICGTVMTVSHATDLPAPNCDPCVIPIASASPNPQTICSGEIVDVVLTADIAGTTFSWIATENANITGESTTAQIGNEITDELVNTSAIDQIVTYTVTPSNSGCEGDPITIDVTVNPSPVVPTITTNTPICAGENAIFTITGTPGDVVTYAGVIGTLESPITIDGGGSTNVVVENAMENQVINLTNITDGTCPIVIDVTETIIVNVLPPTPTLNNISQPSCSDENGVFEITNYNDTYSYFISPDVDVVREGDNVTAPEGVYSIYVNNGQCDSENAFFEVDEQPEVPVIAIGTREHPDACGEPNGSIQITGTGTGDLSWSGAASGSANGITLPYVVENLISGSYTFVFNNGECNSIGVVGSLNDPGAPNIPTLNVLTQPNCDEPNGSFEITNYDASLTYTITPNEDLVVNGKDVTAPAAVYVVTAELDGCISEASEEITINTQPVTPAKPILSTITQPTCDVVNGSFSISNYNSSFDYIFTPSAGVIRNSNQVSAPSGDYTIISDNGQCESEPTSFEIETQPETPIISIGTVESTSTCEGSDGSIQITGSGTGDLSWTGSVSGNAIGIDLPYVVEDLGAGNYTFVFNNGECDSESVGQEVSDPESPDAPILSLVSQPTCEDINGTFIITNYNSDYTYEVSSSENVSIEGDTITAPENTYTVVATFADCSSDVSNSVTIDPQPNKPEAPSVSIIEEPTCENLFASINISTSSAGEIIYELTGVSPVVEMQSNATGDFNELSPGNYTAVVIVDGCSSDRRGFSIDNPNNINANIVSSNATCFGFEDGSITFFINPEEAINYEYSIDGGNEFSDQLVYENLPAGTYNTIVRDESSCSNEKIIQIDENDPISVNIIASSLSINSGEEATLEAEVDPVNENYSYLWTPSSSASCDDCPVITVSPEELTEYSVTVKDLNNCESSNSIEIEVTTQCNDLFLPNVFTPNGDGENDMLCVYGSCIDEMYLEIFNRWGESVFVSKNQNDCWDGTQRGKSLNGGVYAFKYTITLNTGEIVENQGTITLVR